MDKKDLAKKVLKNPIIDTKPALADDEDKETRGTTPAAKTLLRRIAENETLTEARGGNLGMALVVLGGQALYQKWKQNKALKNSKLMYHAPSKTFYGNVAGKVLKPTSEKNAFKALTHDLGYHPDKAMATINKLKAPHDNAPLIKQHNDIAVHFQKKASLLDRAAKVVAGKLKKREGQSGFIGDVARGVRDRMTKAGFGEPATTKPKWLYPTKPTKPARPLINKQRVKIYQNAAKFHLKRAKVLKTMVVNKPSQRN